MDAAGVELEAKKLEISGIVQGVGFRPFVYQLAIQCGVNGEVLNTASGVTILVEGDKKGIETFCSCVEKQSPPLARITHIDVQAATVTGVSGFSIVPSRGDARRTTLISPDVSVCDDCVEELLNPADRRHRYPFINCTNCGPRYTIIDDIPYDRPATSMKHFEMCVPCRSEYDDPMNRRFHAQPNACAVCGPAVTLFDNRRRLVTDPDPIEKTAALLKKGHIVAIKGLGGYHLAVDATNDGAVELLRRRKGREEKPFAVMSRDLDAVRRYACIGSGEEVLLLSRRRPIVLLKKRSATTGLADAVSPDNAYFGVMLPYTPLHYLLMEHPFAALVMTSGNISEEPICIDNSDAFERLEEIADFFLIHNRDIYLRSDDSIVRRSAGAERFIRRSRGYVPEPVFLKRKQPSVLACGGELKNTVCLTQTDRAFMSQHIGDLENLETYRFLELTVRHLCRILDFRPEIIACDLHPDYLSTRYAEAQTGMELVRIQHHHAHIVSCLAENRADGPVIGLAFDGTGYGSDGTVWGGEVLVTEVDHFDRVGHLSCVAMPGSAAAIKEPWRMAVSYLYEAFGDGVADLDLPVTAAVAPEKIRTAVQMIKGGINSPRTSSLGRLFDGVAAIVGLRTHVHYEGQAAMALETATGELNGNGYEFGWETVEGTCRIPVKSIIRGVVKDVRKGKSVEWIGARFHDTLIRLFTELCQQIRRDTGLKRVALSGGSFQNDLLLTGLIRELEGRLFTVFTHQKVPANDGGLSLGQAVAAAAMAKR